MLKVFCLSGLYLVNGDCTQMIYRTKVGGTDLVQICANFVPDSDLVRKSSWHISFLLMSGQHCVINGKLLPIILATRITIIFAQTFRKILSSTAMVS